MNTDNIQIRLVMFGDKLCFSRESGREAYKSLQSGLLKNASRDDVIEIDFSDIKVLCHGWADEVVIKIAEQFKNAKLLNTDNVTVQATLKTLREYSDLKI